MFLPGGQNFIHKSYLILITCLLYYVTGFSQLKASNNPVPSKKRINLVISSSSQKVEIAQYSFQFQAHMNRLFHGKKFHFMIVKSLDEAVKRITQLMIKEDAMIGNLWLDSHGHLGRRISLVEIGINEINHNTIKEPKIEVMLKNIGLYCDSVTKIGLGSCYSGASFKLPQVDRFPEQRMNGDSLMIRISELMNGANVFGSESWVMTKPGIFNGSQAMGGHPLAKRFKDPVALPAWKELGEWTSYSSITGQFRKVRTISLDNNGNIYPNYLSYLASEKKRKKQMKTISRLKKGNFKIDYYYRYEFPPDQKHVKH